MTIGLVAHKLLQSAGHSVETTFCHVATFIERLDVEVHAHLKTRHDFKACPYLNIVAEGTGNIDTQTCATYRDTSIQMVECYEILFVVLCLHSCSAYCHHCQQDRQYLLVCCHFYIYYLYSVAKLG